MVCDMPEQCKFSCLDSSQNRFLWTDKGVDLASHPVVGLVAQVGDVGKFSQALGFEGMDPFLRVSKQGPYFTAIKKDFVHVTSVI